MQDITYRAVETLKHVDGIICEDTRQTGKLLKHYELDNKMYILNDFNEDVKAYEYLEMLKNGLNLALVSDSGTPLISDPGFKLVREALKAGVKVVSVPGPSAVVSALSVSGLPSDSFLFIGFLPKNKTNRVRKLEQILNLKESKLSPTVIIYETPHAIYENLKLMQTVFGDIEIVVTRELTKIHEETIMGKISEVLENKSIKNPKGEFVVLLHLS